jgi:hypothetical protein
MQERDPEFPPYDGNPETFLRWIVAVEEEENNNKLPDQVAITFAINALGSHARGTTGEGKTFATWYEFVAHLKKRFCPESFEYNRKRKLPILRFEVCTWGQATVSCSVTRGVFHRRIRGPEVGIW